MNRCPKCWIRVFAAVFSVCTLFTLSGCSKKEEVASDTGVATPKGIAGSEGAPASNGASEKDQVGPVRGDGK
jgi:hypothetical protein